MRAFLSMRRMDPRIRPYVIRTGFYDIYRLGHIMINWPLITCLVERWHPETHTFHVPLREMTITLQDVAIILGLRIDGLAFTGTCMLDVSELCGELLSVTHLLMLSNDLLSPSSGYVSNYPPQDLMLMRSIWSGVHVGSS